MYQNQDFMDQMGRKIRLPRPPQRIISLVPSQTELLHYLGLDQEVVGITKFCEHPPEWGSVKRIIGGTKQFHFDRIAALQPDLLIGNKEENERSQIEQLAQSYPIWMSDIKTLADALAMIRSIGQLTACSSLAESLAVEIQQAFAQLKDQLAPSPSRSAAYLIWRSPYMVAASDTFIDHLLSLAGFSNVFADQQRYPIVTAEELREAAPEFILLSSEPYPFKAKHQVELAKICPKSVIKLVDGALFSWYGNRLLLAAPYFSNLQLEINKV